MPRDGAIRNKHWDVIGFGDGFHAYRDPHEPDVVYVEFQGGQLLRYHLATVEIKWVAPLPGEGEKDYRFNWNAPIYLSTATPGTIYYGGQYLFRSRDRGESWEKISPDLTSNDPKRQRQLQSGGLTIDNSTAENNTTIYTISESPKSGDVIWAGTDDGYLQLTRDGGKTWKNVVGNVPGVPAGTWVSHVEASPHSEGAAHVAFDGHRTGDMAVYLYRTGDYGETWESVAGEGVEGFAHVVAQDPVNPELLFAGTEFGLYVTVDGGARWARFAGDLPKVPVHDLDIHPRDHALVLGTHGRGVYILDDITPLRALTAEVLESKLALLPSHDAVMVLSGGAQSFPGDEEFVGRNPPEAAGIVFYQSRRHIFGDLKVEVFDESGELITTLPAGKRKGMNRVDWPMRLPAPKMAPATSLAPAFVGPRVPEGTYTYKLTKGKDTFEGQVTLVPDPRSPHSAEDRALQQKTGLELYRMLERLTYVVDAAIDLRDQAKERAAGMGPRDRLAKSLRAHEERLDAFRKTLVSTSEAGWISGDEKLREKMAAIYGAVTGYDGRPTRSQLDRTVVLEGQLAAAESKFAEMTAVSELAATNKQLESKKLEPLSLMSREAWEEKQEKTGAASATLGPKAAARLLGRGLLYPLGF